MDVISRVDAESIEVTDSPLNAVAPSVQLRRRRIAEPILLPFTLTVFVGLLCLSNYLVSQDVSPVYHMGFDRVDLWGAIAFVAIVAICTAPLLTFAAFSFGYVVSFYFLAIIVTYLWFSHFTELQYDHVSARWFAIISLVTFCVPALFLNFKVTWPKFPSLSARQIDVLTTLFLLIAASIFAYAASSNFHITSFYAGRDIREEISYPAAVNYAIGISVFATLPFCYAWYIRTSRPIMAVVTIVVLSGFYPVTLTKSTFLAPAWLLFITIVTSIFRPKLAVIFSLLIPLTAGLLALLIDPRRPEMLFRLVNFRMLAIPGSGLDHYYHYFSHHPLTHFCQISIIGKLFSCAMPDQIGVIMSKEYQTGHYNASLLATEGIASVGPYIAPVATFICGVIVGVFNIASRGIDYRFVLLSSAMITQTMMNVPLSTIMLTHGGAVLIILWFMFPRRALAKT